MAEERCIRLGEISDQTLKLKNWYCETFQPDFGMEYHQHPQIEMMYCESGSFEFCYKDDPDTEHYESVTVSKNCLILVNTGYYHRIAISSPATKILNLEFIPASGEPQAEEPLKGRFHMKANELFSVNEPLKKMKNDDRDLYIFVDSKNLLFTIQEIIHQAKKPDSQEKALMLRLLTAKLFLDLSHCSFSETNKRTGIRYIDVALAYIYSNFMNRLTVSDIAAQVKVSTVYLQKMFKTHCGKNVHDVITEARLKQVKYLLENSSMSIGEISASCGFGSREQLMYEFKKDMGCSLSEYRAENNRRTIRFFSSAGEKKLPLSAVDVAEGQ